MIARTISQRVEISFWNILIPLLSNSMLFRKVFRAVYLFARDHQDLAWIPTIVFSFAGLGLVTGFVLGRMGASLW